MTNEEAVRVLNTCIAATYIKDLPMGKTEDVREALDMGVVALSNSDKDSISRQAVLDKIKEVCFSKEQEWVDFRVSQGSNGQRDLIIKFIESLPSIQPKPIDGDAISRKTVNTLIDELARAISDERSCISRGRDTATIIQEILGLPSIQPTAKENLVIGDYISRQAALDKAILVDNGFGYEFKAVEIEEIQALPSIRPKTGHWISDKNGQYCDKCGNGIKTPYNFCPFCGADMREYTKE